MCVIRTLPVPPHILLLATVASFLVLEHAELGFPLPLHSRSHHWVFFCQIFIWLSCSVQTRASHLCIQQALPPHTTPPHLNDPSSDYLRTFFACLRWSAFHSSQPQFFPVQVLLCCPFLPSLPVRRKLRKTDASVWVTTVQHLGQRLASTYSVTQPIR